MTDLTPKHLEDWELPSGIAPLLMRNEDTGGNMPVSLFMSADMRSCWFDINTGSVPFDLTKLRVYGQLPVKHPAFYHKLFTENFHTIDTVMGQLLHTQMLPGSDEEKSLIIALDYARDTTVDDATLINLSDLNLPTTIVESNAGHSETHFPYLPTFDYNVESEQQCLVWWAAANKETLLHCFTQYADNKSLENDFQYVPYRFETSIANLIAIAQMQLDDASA